MVYVQMFTVFLVSICLSSVVLAAQGAVALKGTSSESTISGEIKLTEENDGLTVDAKVMNVSPGKHGFHFHENADCSDSGKAAGGHFNPDKVDHGFMPKDGMEHAHAGDMGNIEVGEDGTGSLQVFLHGLSLSEGKYSVAGRSVILHEKEDDFGQPTGNAGGRIGCGLVEVN